MKDSEIIHDILNGGKSRLNALSLLYNSDSFKKRIESLVYYFGGSREEVEEILTETIIIFDRNVRNGLFKENSSIQTYIFSIARHYYYVKRRKRSIHPIQIDELEEEPIAISNPELICIDQEAEQLLLQILGQLGEKCKKILRYWSSSYSYKEIASIMQLHNAGNARKRKHDCLKKLENYLVQNPSISAQFVSNSE